MQSGALCISGLWRADMDEREFRRETDKFLAEMRRESEEFRREIERSTSNIVLYTRLGAILLFPTVAVILAMLHYRLGWPWW
jgi:hypothetical protein